MKGRRTGNSGPPEGSGHPWRIPQQISESDRCVVKVDWPKCKDGGLRLDMEAIAFAEYIVGADTTRPGASGRGVHLVKGRESMPVKMFASQELEQQDQKIQNRFAERWLQGDPRLGGQDRSRWNLSQAWCVNLMRKKMSAARYRHNPAEQNLFRIRLCPDVAAGNALAKADRMQEFTRRFMAGVEADFSAQARAKSHFTWVAGAHYNVDHPHVHIGVRGITLEGDHVYFSQQYLRPTARELEANAAASSPIEWRARSVLREMFGGEVQRAG